MPILRSPPLISSIRTLRSIKATGHLAHRALCATYDYALGHATREGGEGAPTECLACRRIPATVSKAVVGDQACLYERHWEPRKCHSSPQETAGREGDRGGRFRRFLVTFPSHFSSTSLGPTTVRPPPICGVAGTFVIRPCTNTLPSPLDFISVKPPSPSSGTQLCIIRVVSHLSLDLYHFET